MSIKYSLAVAAVMIASLFSLSAHAHARLEATAPKADTTVAAAPREIRLQFNEPVELTFSKISLLDQKGVQITPSKIEVDKSNPKAMIAAIPPLHSGLYRVQWTTVTRDGHKVKGEFSFQVK